MTRCASPIFTMTIARTAALRGSHVPPQGGPNLPRESRSSREKFTDSRGDLPGMRFQGEVAGVEEADIGVRDVPLERLRARWKEERVMLPPYRQQARLVRAEVVLERWVERYVALVVAE